MKVGKEYYDKNYWTTGTKSGYINYGPDWPIHKAISEMLVSCFSPAAGDRALDYGGAFGYHVALLQEAAGCKGFLVDASEHAVANAPAALKGRTYWLDVGESPLPFPAEFFDIVFAIEVMEHVYTPEVDFALAELHRVLKPGSPLYASIDAPRAGGQANTPECEDKSHQSLHPLQWWVCQFERAGLDVDESLTARVRAFVSPLTPYAGRPLGECMRWTQLVLKRGND